jgi:DNA processing protein
MSPEAEAYLALNLLSGIGPIRARRLRERFGSVDRALCAREDELRQVEGIGKDLAGKIRHGDHKARAITELARATELGINIVTQADANYPALLREIDDPPLVLYVKGVVPTTSAWPRGIAVVGSRQTSQYGLEQAKKLSYQLAYSGVPVVSGLARGIDTSAHMGALAAKGVTWAVLGCGLEQMYPPENKALADKIVEGKGLLMSELPLGTPPDKSTFPMRNRIVSGLCFGVLVIEAAIDSGALITARQAAEQGRQIFAMPGRVDNPLSKGCHSLLKQGAKLVEEAADILDELEFIWPKESLSTSPRPMPANLSPEEETIFGAIDKEEVPIDAITQKTGLPSGIVSSTLLRLEMKKLVKQLPGKLFVRTA